MTHHLEFWYFWRLYFINFFTFFNFLITFWNLFHKLGIILFSFFLRTITTEWSMGLQMESFFSFFSFFFFFFFTPQTVGCKGDLSVCTVLYCVLTLSYSSSYSSSFSFATPPTSGCRHGLLCYHGLLSYKNS